MALITNTRDTDKLQGVQIEPETIEDPTNIENDAAHSQSTAYALNVDMLQPLSLPTERPFMPEIPPEASVLGATFRRGNVIGLMINSTDFKQFDNPDLNVDNYNFMDYIPLDLFDKHFDKYIATKNPTHAEALTRQLREEEEDNQVRANHPWRSIGASLLMLPIDPLTYMPGGTLYKSAKQGYSIAKSFLSVGSAAAGAMTIENIVKHNTQLTAELSDSMYEVAGAALIGGIAGTMGAALVNGAIFNKAKKETIAIMADESPIGPKLTPEQSLSAAKVRDPALEKELNSLYGGTVTAAAGKFLGYVTKSLTPMSRLIFSPFASSRAVINEMVEHNMLLNANLPGKRRLLNPDGTYTEVERAAMPKGISVESDIKATKRHMQKLLIDYQDIFYKQAGINKGLFKIARTVLTEHKGLKLEDFEKQVWRSVVTGKESENTSVKEAADLVVNKFFEPVKQEYIRLGVFTPDVSVKTAASYFMRVYNKKKLLDPTGRANAKAKFEAYIKKNDNILRDLKPQIDAIQKEIELLKKSKTKQKAILAAEKRLGLLVPESLWTSKGTIREIMDPDYYGIEADKIIDNIIGMGEDKNLNPILASLPGGKPNVLKERKFLIDDIDIEDELVTSFLDVAPMFMNATAPNVAMLRYAERLGIEGSNVKGFKIQALEDDYRAAVAENPNKQQKLYKKYQKDKRDISAVFDMLGGVYGNGVNVMDATAAKFVRSLSNFNYLRLMGLVTLSALPDVGSIGMKQGFFRVVWEGLVPLLKTLEHAKHDKDFLKDLSFTCHTVQGYKLKGIMEQDVGANEMGMMDRALTSTDKGLSYMTQSYGNVNLMNKWTDTMEFMAGKTSIGRTLRAINTWKETGAIKQKEANRLNELGISHENYEIIYNQMKKHGGKTNGSYWINYSKWDSDDSSMRAFAEFKRAVTREIDEIVVSSPSVGAKPLFTHSAIGGLIFQFKSYSYAATSKTLIAGLQRGDSEFIQGLMMTAVMSLLGYASNCLIRGQEIDYSYDNLFKETMDRSGILGVLGNGYNLLNKLKVIPGQSVTRYRNRGAISSLLGPSAGIVEDSIDMISKLANFEDTHFKEKDVYKAMRLLPYQNYIFTHKLSKMLGKSFAEHLGLEASPE